MTALLKRIAPIRILHAVFGVYLFLDRRERTATAGYIFYGDELLLIRQTYDNKGWTVPGGFAERQEDPEAGLRRESREEVGLSLAHVELLRRDRDDRPYMNLTVHRFYAESTSRDHTIDRFEVKEARWFPIEEARGMLKGHDIGLKEAIAKREERKKNRYE